MKELEKENAELKKMYAEMSLENRAKKSFIEKKFLTPQEKREAVNHFVKDEQLSTRKACQLAGKSRTTYQYKKKLKDDTLMQQALTQLNQKHPAIGFWQCCYRL